LAHRAGFVALVGLPNAGKSTLLNQLVGEKLAIVTPKAQTTRRRLRGIYTDPRGQIVFVDTPGLVEPRYLLHEAMLEQAAQAAHGADLIVGVADAAATAGRAWALEYEPPAGISAVLCVNKVDLAASAHRGSGSPEALADFCTRAEETGRWHGLFQTDARRGRGVARLRDAVMYRLPESPPLYPEDDLSDAPVRELAAELVREACLRELSDEVPYAVAVVVERFERRPGDRPDYVQATVFVERPSQKGIVIGAGGSKIKRIGEQSRPGIEQLVGKRIYLELRVRVLAKWRKNPAALRRLGFRDAS